MDILKKENNNIVYITKVKKDKEYKKLENITANELKDILTLAYTLEGFKYQEININEIPNPIEKIIFTHLKSKLNDILAKREHSIKEHISTFTNVLEEYKQKQDDQ